MDDSRNTIYGWVLAGAATALGLSIISGKYYHADSPEAPETAGYLVAGAEPADGGAGDQPSIAEMMASASADAGAKVFSKCGSCHSIEKGGATGIGPNLYGVLGKPHGAVAGFAYSDAIKSISEPWSFENMDAWLTSPRRYADGTKMSFAGLSKAEDRANVIAYLNQNSDNPLPMPQPKAEEPSDLLTEEGDADTTLPTGSEAPPTEATPATDAVVADPA